MYTHEYFNVMMDLAYQIIELQGTELVWYDADLFWQFSDTHAAVSNLIDEYLATIL